MHAERRSQLRQGRAPRGRRDGRTAVAIRDARHVVAEDDDDVAVEGVGFLHDAADALGRHPRLDGMDVGDDHDPERPLVWPAGGREIPFGDNQPETRLITERVAAKPDAPRAGSAKPHNELAAGDHPKAPSRTAQLIGRVLGGIAAISRW